MIASRQKTLTEAAASSSLFLEEEMDEDYLEVVVGVNPFWITPLFLSLIALGNHVKTHMVGAYSDNPNNAHQW